MLIKYSGKYVKIYLIMKITYSIIFPKCERFLPENDNTVYSHL